MLLWIVYQVLLILVGWGVGWAPADGSPLLDDVRETVPVEEYPVYDRIIEAKFLTSLTRVVLIERLTRTTIYPEQDEPLSQAMVAAQGFFQGQLPGDLVREFAVKNLKPARLQTHFNFGAPYRFVTPEGEDQPEVKRPVVPVVAPRLVQGYDPERIDRLGFSRVGFTLRGDQALAYVANNRPDGSGAGFLIWLYKSDQGWEIIDTEVLWTARMEPAERSGR